MKIGQSIEGRSELNLVFTTKDVAKHLDVPAHDVRYWVEASILSPSIKRGSKQGEHHLFNTDDLKLAFFINYLHQMKVKPAEIKSVLSEVRRVINDPNLLVQPMLIPCGARPLILQHADAGHMLLLDATRPGQYVMTIALEAIDEKVRRIIAQSK